MLAICPSNKKHKEFFTVAHVMQEWRVDEHGEWLETIDDALQVSFPPRSDNIWVCAECGSEATVMQ